MAKPTRPYAAIADALEDLDRADRARLAAQVAYEAAERGVFAAIGRAIGPGDQGLDDDAIGTMPDAAIDALGPFFRERGLDEYRITHRDAMWRARDAAWLAGR